MFDNKILEKLKLFVEEDIGYSDITTDTLINDDLKIQAEITSQSSGIIAGLNLWKQFFINCNCDFKVLVQDGDIVNNNQIIAEIQGSANKILKYERTFLNLVSRMSGIATETNKFKENWLMSGSTLPYMGFNLLPLSVIPNLRLTNKGLVNVNTMNIIPLFE